MQTGFELLKSNWSVESENLALGISQKADAAALVSAETSLTQTLQIQSSEIMALKARLDKTADEVFKNLPVKF